MKSTDSRLPGYPTAADTERDQVDAWKQAAAWERCTFMFNDLLQQFAACTTRTAADARETPAADRVMDG